MKIQRFKISDVIPNKDNPRIIKDENYDRLLKSIKEFPDMSNARPLILNKDNVILGGNMRFKAMKEAGWKDVPVIVTDFDEERQKEFIIKDNVSGGDWDWDLLNADWDVGKLDEWGLDVPEFDQKVNDNEYNDLSDKIKNDFRIEIILKDEESQEKIYNELIEKGYECRLLTL